MVLRWLIALLVVATISAACGPKPAESADATPVPIASADLSGSGPGTLVSAMSMPVLGQSSEGRTFDAARVVYRSTNGDTGEGTEVSGSVFVPKGTAPDGGWPVISFGHGTTGLDEPCGPSLSATLLGFTTIVAGYVSKGYAVALADYQGLGAPGHHPYTDSKTAGLNMIDAVRALRHTVDGVSDRWAAVGGSQGGGAAWAADEQAASYAPELKLVGAVAYVPAADVTGLVDKAVAGTMTTDQSLAFQGIVESLARLHPDVVETIIDVVPPPPTGTCCRRARVPRRPVGMRRRRRCGPSTSRQPALRRPTACVSRCARGRCHSNGCRRLCR